jgi:hypothetical protein
MTTRSPGANRKAARTKRRCAYVLWGDGFDEVLAVTFVTELRKAGLQVKLVGLRQQPMAGAYGVILVPEIGLEEALAEQEQLSCLVVPCDDVGWQRLQQEPRLCQLLAQRASLPIPLLSCHFAVTCSLTAFQPILIASDAAAAFQMQMQQVIATIKGA